MIGKTLGNLRIVSELGRGGMGIVYLAEHKVLNKKFAVKSLSPALTEDTQFGRRFYQEAVNQALLDHPNIVQATDFFEQDQQFFFVMEYVDGQDLGELIRKKGSLPEEEALSIFKHILEGLDFAHNRGIIHRDVKPPNVMVDTSGRARIMDFGIAVMFGAERLTSAGTPVGSPWYMSPEQITHPQDIDHRSDVYSAGILLYEMLTGEVPFDGKSDFSVKEQQVNAPRPDPRGKNPQISPELARMVLKAIDKDPDKRFQGCAEFLDHIKAYEMSKTIQPAWPPKWLLVSLAIVAIIGIGVVLYAILLPPETVDTPAALLLDVGSKEAAILCRQFIEMDITRENLNIAHNLNNRELVLRYRNQIRDKELNIRDGLSRYNDILKKLGILEKSLVADEFRRYFKDLEIGRTPADEAAERTKIGRILQLHYQQYNHQGGEISILKMREACTAR